MKKTYYIFLLLPLLFVGGCVESMSTAPDNKPPVLEVTSPKSNDTVAVGYNVINYQSSDDQKISFYEVYVNGTFVAPNFPTGKNGEKPVIYLKVDSSLINKRISYYVKAYDGTNSTQSVVMSDLFVVENKSAPVAPYNLQLTRLGIRVVNLLWADSSLNEQGFEVWRKEGEGAYQLIQTLPKNAVSTNDSTLLPDKDYYYKIRAYNRYGYADSRVVSRISSGYIPPPANLKGASYGTSRIVLSWSDLSDGELGFIIERKPNSGSSQFKQIALAGPNAVSFEDKNGLSGSTVYIYRICALGQMGKSEWSDEIQVATLSYEIVPPSQLTAGYSQTEGGVVLSWKDNSMYEIETRVERRSTEESVFTEIGKAGTDITSYTDKSAAGNKNYIYRIRGYMNDGHYSEYSAQTAVFVPGN